MYIFHTTIRVFLYHMKKPLIQSKAIDNHNPMIQVLTIQFHLHVRLKPSATELKPQSISIDEKHYIIKKIMISSP